MSKNINEIIEQEVKVFTEGLNKEELLRLIPTLNENISLINALEKLDKEEYNKDDQTSTENWNFFIGALKKVSKLEQFQGPALVVNAKLYTLKKFTKLEFKLPKDIEGVLKFELKKYFHNLVTNDADEFIQEFYKLPFEFVSLVIRYITKTLDPKLTEVITPSEETAEAFYSFCLKTKQKCLKNINDVSLGITTNFDMADVRLMLDTKAFYSYNALNVGALEYIIRLLNDSTSQENLHEHFGESIVDYLRAQALQHPSYIQYLKKIKAQEIEPFFKSDGTQNDERPKSFDDFIKELFEPENVIPKKPETANTQIVAQPTELEIPPPANTPEANAAPATPPQGNAAQPNPLMP